MRINWKNNQVKSDSYENYDGSHRWWVQDNYYYLIDRLSNVSSHSLTLTFVSGQYKLKNYQRSQNYYYDDVSLGRTSIDTYCKRQEHYVNFDPSYIYSSTYNYGNARKIPGMEGYQCITDSKGFRYVGIRSMEFSDVSIYYGSGPNSWNKPSYFKIYAKKVYSNEYN